MLAGRECRHNVTDDLTIDEQQKIDSRISPHERTSIRGITQRTADGLGKPPMNLSDTARMKVMFLQRAVVYDCDVERAEQVATVLKELALEPLLIDH